MADTETILDFFADGIAVSAGTYGFTLTWLVSDPEVDGRGGETRLVARSRMSAELARALRDGLTTALENIPAPATSVRESD